jgi:hypothetical protein
MPDLSLTIKTETVVEKPGKMTNRDGVRAPEKTLEEVPPVYTLESVKPYGRYETHDSTAELSNEMARADINDGFVFVSQAINIIKNGVDNVQDDHERTQRPPGDQVRVACRIFAVTAAITDHITDPGISS